MSEQTPRDDLVERLRLNFGIHPDWPKSARLAVIDMNAERYQAADRIERLERALVDILNIGAWESDSSLGRTVADIADAALKGQEG